MLQVAQVAVCSQINTKRFILKTQFVPHSKHFISVIKTNQFML